MKLPEKLRKSPLKPRSRPVIIQDINLPFAAVLALVFKWSVAAMIIGAGWTVAGIVLWSVLSPETAPQF